MSKRLWRADEEAQRAKSTTLVSERGVWRDDEHEDAAVVATRGEGLAAPDNWSALWNEGDELEAPVQDEEVAPLTAAKLWDEPVHDTDTPPEPEKREPTPIPAFIPSAPSNGHRTPPRTTRSKRRRVSRQRASDEDAFSRARGVRMRRRRRRRIRRRWLIAMCVVLLLLLADGVYVAYGLKDSLTSSERGLSNGAAALSQGDLDAADIALRGALQAAEESIDLTGHPSVVGLSLFPNLGDDASTLQSLADVSELAARAGLQGLEATRAMGAGQEGELVSTIYNDGRVDFDALETGQPYVERAVDLLRQGTQSLNAAPEPHFALLQEALGTARDEVTGAYESAHKGALLFDLLPGLLGADAERNYLLAFQAPGEARGTGGLLGVFGVLRAADGAISLRKVLPGGELFPERLDPVEAPGWFERAYGDQKALTEFQQANLSPRFPVVAQVLLRMYETQTGEKLAGVLAMDPIALGELLRATGPITDLNGRAITSDNAGEVLMQDSYIEFPNPDDQNVYLADLINSFWSTIETGDLDGPALAKAMSQTVRSQHFKLWARSRSRQKTIEELGAHGWIAPGHDNVQMVFSNNYSVNKVDYFLQRTIDTGVQLNDDGSATVTTTATIENDAPAGPPSLLLGPGIKGDPPGLNRMLLNFLMPKKSFVQDFSINGESTPPIEYKEGVFPVAGYVIDVPAGESVTATIVYSMPFTFDSSNGQGTFSFTLYPQATVNADAFSLSITAPEGLLVPAGSDPDSSNGRITSGILDESRSIQVTLLSSRHE